MRLLTRSDFDGLACACILNELGLIDSFDYVHPKDVQDNTVEITKNDILANVPYHKNCGMWFDHHSSEVERNGNKIEYKGESRPEKSAARIIYNYYGGKDKFPYYEEMLYYVDKVDSGDLLYEEIVDPHGWILLGFIMDPRTGTERNQSFRLSAKELMEKLMPLCGKIPIDELLSDPDIKERTDIFKHQNQLFKKMILQTTKTYSNVMITDLRDRDTIYTGNRFLKYSLFPRQNISIWIVNCKNNESVSIAVGHSILNKSSRIDVGKVMLSYGGGGHKMVGTCQVLKDDADDIIKSLIKDLNA